MAKNLEHENIVESDSDFSDNDSSKEIGSQESDSELTQRSSTPAAAKRVKSIGVTVEERILTIGAEMFENGKGQAGEKEWNKLRIEEMKVYLRHLEVKSAQARVVIERLKSEGI